MRDHIKILGVLNIVWASITIVIGLVVLFVFGGLAGFLSVAGAANSDNGGILVAPFMAILGVFIVAIVCIVSLPALIGGIGLIKYKNWARVLMIIISVLHLFSVPIGTALGVYGLWVLFHDDTKRIFDSNTVPYFPPQPPPPTMAPNP
ncbi:MAG TPA: hypothetical protein VN737_09815 [Bryobacteraceae bacterium]|jgi:hypothetical protein|nr:hypothetical protein [Bryobacteraceae bacterium]